ncbi:acetyl xylan esterase [Coprinopsis cinerea AmutBmut pab1-1]|nr:acetyl xylan esterase [Coprinopsis cinerea AmutBmut pab1-1]
MKSVLSPLSATVIALLSTAAVAVPPYGQCGGSGYTGPSDCDSGYTCVPVNQWYHQCQPGSSAPTNPPNPPVATTTTTAPRPTNSACPGAVTKFRYFGVNQAGAEFGSNIIPGELGTHYIWPAPSSIDFFVNEGFNTFRIPFQLERLNPPARGLTGSFEQPYLQDLKRTVDYITRNKNSFAIIEPHNYMRYANQTITNVSQFSTCKFLASLETCSRDLTVLRRVEEPCN